MKEILKMQTDNRMQVPAIRQFVRECANNGYNRKIAIYGGNPANYNDITPVLDARTTKLRDFTDDIESKWYRGLLVICCEKSAQIPLSTHFVNIIVDDAD